jgi:hypothetical protein
MPDTTQRLNAVIAALEKVRDHVAELDETEDVAVSTYNRWIAMLDGVVEGNWKALALEGDVLPANAILMHTEAAIAFLEACLEA